MKLTDDLPKWFENLFRFTVYGIFIVILSFPLSKAAKSNLKRNISECLYLTAPESNTINHAKDMVSCLKRKNGIIENLLMYPTYKTIGEIPKTPYYFVGTWEATQPICKYKHRLYEDGTFMSDPISCRAISSGKFRGNWSAYNDQFIWLSNQNDTWPPDINKIDIVDNDFFLLTENNGTRTRFIRINETNITTPQVNDPENSDVTNMDPNTNEISAAAATANPVDMPDAPKNIETTNPN